MTTYDGDKPDKPKKKRKSNAAKPRLSELVYLREQGESVDDAESKRRDSTLVNVLRLGNDLETPIGRECERDRKYFMDWLTAQAQRADSVGRLARELEAHESSLGVGEPAPDSWIKVKSRITRGIIGGGRELRGVVDEALAEFRTRVVLPDEAVREAAE